MGESNTGRLGEWLFLALIVVCMLLILVELGTNVLEELEARRASNAATQEVVGATQAPSAGLAGEMGMLRSAETGICA